MLKRCAAGNVEGGGLRDVLVDKAAELTHTKGSASVSLQPALSGKLSIARYLQLHGPEEAPSLARHSHPWVDGSMVPLPSP
jgi:hypothetical protein